MDFVLLKVFPIALALGGLLWIPFELKTYFRERKSGHHRNTKLFRRLLASVMLIVLAGMVYFGELPQPGVKDAELTMKLFRHWVVVLGMAMFLGGLAVWDALEGMRHLKKFITRVEQEELEALRLQVGMNKLDSGK